MSAAGNGSVRPQSLPPGPPMPAPVQTAIWFGKAQWMLGQCAARQRALLLTAPAKVPAPSLTH